MGIGAPVNILATVPGTRLAPTCPAAIDWETVFENPETGIIPAILMSGNKLILHKVTVEVIKQLFTRKNDEPQVEKFTRELTLILGETEGSEDLPQMKSNIVDLLRRIKDGRIEKAAAYVALKKQEAAEDAKNKRKGKSSKKKRRKGEAEQARFLVIVAALLGGVFVIILAVFAYFFMFDSNESDWAGDHEEAPVVEQEQIESGEEPEQNAIPGEEMQMSTMPMMRMSDLGYPLDKLAKDDVAEMGLNVMVLRHFFWSGRVEGGLKRGTVLVPTLILTDSEFADSICDYSPSMIDAINLALERSTTADEVISPDTLRQAGLLAKDMLNKRLGKSWVYDLYLLYNIEGEMLQTAEKCQLLTPE